jgi:hypothetical protein
MPLPQSFLKGPTRLTPPRDKGIPVQSLDEYPILHLKEISDEQRSPHCEEDGFFMLVWIVGDTHMGWYDKGFAHNTAFHAMLL